MPKSVNDLPIEIVREVFQKIPPSKEFFTKLSLVSKQFCTAVRLIPVCISCTIALAPASTTEVHKQSVWLNKLTNPTFRAIQAPSKALHFDSTLQRQSDCEISEHNEETSFMISVAECHASVSLKAVVFQDHQRIIDFLKEQIDMNFFVGSRPVSAVRFYFEKYDTTGISLDVLDEAKKVAMFAGVLKPSTYVNFIWKDIGDPYVET
ncbi:hypothetical protein HDU76_000277 [Blyttiomyces sp. JEL0837]|nr:hypothetical protein HDU76_000277 [Blyttiomyces sp. JEL0837]